MPFEYRKKFEDSQSAINEMCSISPAIASLIDYNSINDPNLRVQAIVKLCETIIQNPPDPSNDNYPQVPSLSVSSTNLHYRSSNSIGFGIRYNNDDGTYTASISVYVPYRYSKNNALINRLESADGWAYVERPRREYNNDSNEEQSN